MKNADRQRLRVAVFLGQGPATCRTSARPDRLLLDGGSRGTIATMPDIVQAMVDEGLLRRRERSLALSPDGLAFLKRALAQDPFQEQHQERAQFRIDSPAGPVAATINLSESPLGKLVRCKGRDGRPFLSQTELEAGERLRADFTRGQLTPRLTANWIAAVSTGRRAETRGIADLTDAALGARRRFNNAVAAVGPELSGALIDVCCFLKGVETVERERGWPARSAKLMIKAGLGALHRHYNPQAGRTRRSRKVLHWGTDDYRPKIN